MKSKPESKKTKERKERKIRGTNQKWVSAP